jgi:hypothetical protein
MGVAASSGKMKKESIFSSQQIVIIEPNERIFKK